MQEDFEPILERQIHHLINYAQGIMHIGQRDIAWVRIGKAAVDKGFRLSHLGKILHAKFHQDFGAIFDKVQVKVYTEKEKVDQMLDQARAVYRKRDTRIEGMTDETTDIILLLYPLPILCAQPCLCHQPRENGTLRCLQLDGLQSFF